MASQITSKKVMSSQQTRAAVRQTYRELFRLTQRIRPSSKQEESLAELRSTYRETIDSNDENIQNLLHEAGKKIAYLRIITPKPKMKQSNDSGRWVYRNGQAMSDQEANVRTSTNGRVISNWNGSNLDPCSVKVHNQQLKRAGFVNNLHAKGLF